MTKFKPFTWLIVLALGASSFAQVAGQTSPKVKLATNFEPVVSAESATIMDAETGKVLWSKDPDASRFPASTTKIMTAMLLLEHCTPDEVIIAPQGIDKVNQASMHLHPGERITAGDMLYALLLRSANDGCVAVADHVAGSVPKFVEMMNKRAKELGCTNTHFNNPNGLNDDKHTTSAHDLALIARAAMRYPAFAQAVKTYKFVIKRDPKITKDTLMVNHDKYLMKDPTADGIKTGWTVPAGRCFVGSATRNGYRILTVILKSKDWQKDHAVMLDWAFANHEREQVFKRDQTLGPLPVQGGTASEVHLVPTSYPVHIWRSDVPKHLQVRFDHAQTVRAPIRKGDKLGTVTVVDEDGFSQSAELVASEDVPQTAAAHIVSTAAGSPGFLFIGGCLGVGAFYMRAKSRRRFRRQRPGRTIARSGRL